MTCQSGIYNIPLDMQLPLSASFQFWKVVVSGLSRRRDLAAPSGAAVIANLVLSTHARQGGNAYLARNDHLRYVPAKCHCRRTTSPRGLL